MIDPQTGYDETAACECVPCKECGGEGCDTDQAGQSWECFACSGTGRDSSRCEVEHDRGDHPSAATAGPAVSPSASAPYLSKEVA